MTTRRIKIEIFSEFHNRSVVVKAAHYQGEKCLTLSYGQWNKIKKTLCPWDDCKCLDIGDLYKKYYCEPNADCIRLWNRSIL